MDLFEGGAENKRIVHFKPVRVDKTGSYLVPMARQRLIAFTGAGASAESGISTFRDQGGLWEQYRIEDVATPEAWARDPALVLHFYDMRRAQVAQALPNPAHHAIADLEGHFDVDVITQNIDDLHERAGSSRVLHLHGEIMKARSSADPNLILPINGTSLRIGDRCAMGSQLRPHVVWFGEEVPMMPVAAALVSKADLLVIIGTSLNVYPAAGLIHYAPAHCRIFLIDPHEVAITRPGVVHIRRTASTGVPELAAQLLEER